mmetsp:Transcript_64164/g.206703  ORF Transcript_64164/g.206703 Transcript_64164/m.206703 type:complete len:246 (+) Transcript_64164:143-880(+)
MSTDAGLLGDDVHLSTASGTCQCRSAAGRLGCAGSRGKWKEIVLSHAIGRSQAWTLFIKKRKNALRSNSRQPQHMPVRLAVKMRHCGRLSRLSLLRQLAEASSTCNSRCPALNALPTLTSSGRISATAWSPQACAFARDRSSWRSRGLCVPTAPEASAAGLLGRVICQRIIVEGRADRALPPLSDAEAAERCTCLGVHSAHGFLDEGQTCVERAARAVEDLIVAMAHYLAHQLLALQKRGQRQCA